MGRYGTGSRVVPVRLRRGHLDRCGLATAGLPAACYLIAASTMDKM
jgi:hypothetical protein